MAEIYRTFDYARDTVKQLITLSTGIIALTVTFVDRIAGPQGTGGQTYVIIAWLAFLISIVFGVWALMAITGSLHHDSDGSTGGIYSNNVRIPAMLQVGTFLLALVFTVVFGISMLQQPEQVAPQVPDQGVTIGPIGNELEGVECAS